MGNIIKLGSLYLNGHPTIVGSNYQPNAVITLGEAIPGKKISWVAVNGMLIADRCILYTVSWNDLNNSSLVFGQEATIDGFQYTVRCLKVGGRECASNEWDAALDAVGEDNGIWRWDDALFWGQETPERWALSRAIRGHHSARYWCYNSATRRDAAIGFRPVLVPLFFDLDESMIGRRVAVWAGQGIVYGKLNQLTEYDIVLSDWKNQTFLDADRDKLALLPDERLVVDRATVTTQLSE